MINRKVELHDVDVSAFIHALDSCTGNVYLETEEGDCINLKSRLSQLLGIATIIKGGSVTSASLRCENAEDESKLFRFDLFGEVPDKSEDDAKA
ncbi:MAG: hypothetical protein LUH54_04940 [Firmicutes bacterium]|nr:hypothetical protein [Bacillota bacterium]